MDNKYQVYVNGKMIPYPDAFHVEMQEIEDDETGRTLDATMDKNSLGFVYYITMDYEWIPSFKVAKLSCLKKNTYVEVKYFNPFENRVITQTMFTGNPTCDHIGWAGRNCEVPMYDFHIEFTNKATRKQSEIPDIDDISEE